MKKLIFYFFTLSMILLSSCSATKFTYLNDMKESESYFVKEKGELIVKNRDRLSIVVSCKEPDLANLFNIRGDFSSVNGVASSTHQTRGYKVDDQGSLDYPLIGRIEVAGKTLDEISELIRNKIIEGGFIKDPFVTTDILNFKYTVLGAATPQVYYSEDGSITILRQSQKPMIFAVSEE
jgi:Periplasmic protein involved in polysaccharide export